MDARLIIARLPKLRLQAQQVTPHESPKTHERLKAMSGGDLFCLLPRCSTSDAGLGRQDTQVACVTELTNQNQKDTLVQAADVGKDAFIVDDRGGRHQRSGFFLNVDGDQRQRLDICCGKTARFILMFDDAPTKVQKVALRSSTAGLDVEEISLIVTAPQVSAPAGQQHQPESELHL